MPNHNYKPYKRGYPAYQEGDEYSSDVGMNAFNEWLQYYAAQQGQPNASPEEARKLYQDFIAKDPDGARKALNTWGSENNYEPLANADLGAIKGSMDFTRSYQFGDQMPFQGKEGKELYRNVKNVLDDDSGKWTQWKKENPNFEKDAKAYMRSYKAGKAADYTQLGLEGLNTVRKLALSMSQIKQAKDAKKPPPEYAENLRDNVDLAAEYGDARREAGRGMSELERKELDASIIRGYEKRRRDAEVLGRGQASSNMATLLRNQMAGDFTKRAIASENLKMEKGRRADQLLDRKLREDYTQYLHGVNKFRDRDMPLWEANEKARQDLMQMGMLNREGAFDSLAGMIPHAMRNTIGAIYCRDLNDSL